MAYLRICTATPDELHTIKVTDLYHISPELLDQEGEQSPRYKLPKYHAVVNLSNEVRMLNKLMEIVQEILTPQNIAPQSESDSGIESGSNSGNRVNNKGIDEHYSTLHFTTTLAEDVASLQDITTALRYGNSGGTENSVIANLQSLSPSELVQYQWIYTYRITKKQILHILKSNIQLILNYIKSISTPGMYNNTNTVNNAVNNSLISSVELYTKLQQTGYADSSSSGKVDKFHINDYESIANYNNLLNVYIKYITNAIN